MNATIEVQVGIITEQQLVHLNMFNLNVFNRCTGLRSNVSNPYPRKIQYLRERRNELLQATDFYLLPDVVIDENKLNAIKIYRQELRDFINRLLNDEIKCNLIDDDFEAKYFPKLYEMEAKPKKSFYNKERYEKRIKMRY